VSKSLIRLKKAATGGVTGIGAALILLATLAGSAAQAPSTQPATGTAAPSSVSAGGITLRSVSVVLPESQRTFAGGGAAEAINKDCLICHSAGMVLTQPEMSIAQWKAEEEKMRSAYDAPIDPKDDDVITDYLAKLRLTNAAAAYQQISSHQADPEHGKVIAEQGTVGGAPGCAGCHALNGSSDGSGAFPRIAGQSAYYLGKQMQAFASDLRNNAIMSAIAKALSANDIADVTMPASTRHSRRCRNRHLGSFWMANDSLRQVIPTKVFQRAKIAMGPAVQAIHPRFLILPDSTRTTSPPSCKCGGTVTARPARKSC